MGSSTAAVILEMLMFLMEAIQTNFQQTSAVGSSSRAQKALNELHTQDKAVEMTDQLMVWRPHFYFFLFKEPKGKSVWCVCDVSLFLRYPLLALRKEHLRMWGWTTVVIRDRPYASWLVPTSCAGLPCASCLHLMAVGSTLLSVTRREK